MDKYLEKTSEISRTRSDISFIKIFYGAVVD